MKELFISVFLLMSPFLFCQKSASKVENRDFDADRTAKEAAGNIMWCAGLTQDIEIVQKDVPNVIAYVRQGRRYVGYNPAFLMRLRENARTNWAIYSVLAHEIGHHLSGHTEVSGKTNPGNELSADYFSGFNLRHLGASLPDALSALRSLKTLGEIRDTIYHPPFDVRCQAVEQGWTNANKQIAGEISRIPSNQLGNHFVYRCRFAGDANIYYIDRKDCVFRSIRATVFGVWVPLKRSCNFSLKKSIIHVSNRLYEETHLLSQFYVKS